MALRHRTLNQINAALSQSGYYKAADFTVTAKESSKQTQLIIEYKYNPAFFFHAAIPLERTTVGAFSIGLRYTPGELNSTETGSVQNLDGLTGAISNWTDRMRGESLATPEMRALEEQQRLLAELTNGMSQVPNEYFTQDEAKEMRVRLDAFEEKLAKNLEENTENKDELAKKIKELTADVQMLRDNLSALTKQNWAVALCTRAFGWLKDPSNQKLLKSGAEVVHIFLEDGKPHK